MLVNHDLHASRPRRTCPSCHVTYNPCLRPSFEDDAVQPAVCEAVHAQVHECMHAAMSMQELHPGLGALTALTSLELSKNALMQVDEQVGGCVMQWTT